MGKVDVARQTVVAREIRVVEDVVVEAVASKEVAAVVGAIEAPVVAQALGTENQSAVVSQLVIFDDGQRLEGFAKPDAVGDDAPAEAVELIDGAHDTVSLELEELLPHFRIPNTRG